MGDLPDELKLHIMYYLSLEDILNLEQINRSFKGSSGSSKGLQFWHDRLSYHFQNSLEFKTSSMSFREMYIRLYGLFMLLKISPRDFPGDLSLRNTIRDLFNHPNKPVEGINGRWILPEILTPLNPDNERGIAKYIIDLCERSIMEDPPYNHAVFSTYVYEHMLYTYDDFEMIEWYHQNYKHDINLCPSIILKRIESFPFPKHKLDYLISLTENKGYLKYDLRNFLQQPVALRHPKETHDHIREILETL